MDAETGYSTPGIAGSGAIACGLAACATIAGRVTLLARSDASAWRAEEQATTLAGKVERGDPSNVKVTTKVEDLAECDLIVEAIAEDHDAKVELLHDLARAAIPARAPSVTQSSTSSIFVTGLKG